jgi:hypothetical protein
VLVRSLFCLPFETQPDGHLEERHPKGERQRDIKADRNRNRKETRGKERKKTVGQRRCLLDYEADRN